MHITISGQENEEEKINIVDSTFISSQEETRSQNSKKMIADINNVKKSSEMDDKFRNNLLNFQ